MVDRHEVAALERARDAFVETLNSARTSEAEKALDQLRSALEDSVELLDSSVANAEVEESVQTIIEAYGAFTDRLLPERKRQRALEELTSALQGMVDDLESEPLDNKERILSRIKRTVLNYEDVKRTLSSGMIPDDTKLLFWKTWYVLDQFLELVPQIRGRLGLRLYEIVAKALRAPALASGVVESHDAVFSDRLRLEPQTDTLEIDPRRVSLQSLETAKQMAKRGEIDRSEIVECAERLTEKQR
jgi:hypothetical protein